MVLRRGLLDGAGSRCLRPDLPQRGKLGLRPSSGTVGPDREQRAGEVFPLLVRRHAPAQPPRRLLVELGAELGAIS